MVRKEFDSYERRTNYYICSMITAILTPKGHVDGTLAINNEEKNELRRRTI